MAAGRARVLNGAILALCAAIVWSVAPDARGQMDTAALKAIAGKEKKPHDQTTLATPPLTAAESQTLLAKLQAIRRVLVTTPAIQSLHGYDWAMHARIAGHEPGRPLEVLVGLIAYPYFFNARANRAESSAEGAPFTIYVNNPDIVVGQDGYHVDEEARFTFAPASAGTLDGYPAYFESDHFVVITKEPRPLFVGVTVQQYLDVRIARARASFASMESSLSSLPDSPSKRTALDREKGRLTALESELAGLSAAERQAPALYADGVPTSRPSSLAGPGATRTRAIVTPNPGLFDPRLPRTAVQLIVLGSIRYQPTMFGLLQTQIDKAALAKLFD